MYSGGLRHSTHFEVLAYVVVFYLISSNVALNGSEGFSVWKTASFIVIDDCNLGFSYIFKILAFTCKPSD